jgi:acetyl-CoA carboxylase biotin carboxyl carrier protein
MDIDMLKKIIELMKDSDLKILNLKDDDLEIYLEAHSETEFVSVSPAVSGTNSINQTQIETDASQTADNIVEIRASQIGVFYTQPEEDSTDTFVSVGDHVEVGDQIGLIETMKLFNEVTVEQAGTIEEILVENGEAVEYDQVLMLLKVEE